MHERIPSEYDGPPPSGRERFGYFAAWVAVAAAIAVLLVLSFS